MVAGCAERDPDFAQNVVKQLGQDAKIIVACDIGGTLSTKVECKHKKKVSRMACSALHLRAAWTEPWARTEALAAFESAGSAVRQSPGLAANWTKIVLHLFQFDISSSVPALCRTTR
jgi:hypothetical protein